MTPKALSRDWTPDDFKNIREDKAIKANIKIGGKLFCWHDFTSVGKVTFNSNAIPFICVKCGEYREFTYSKASSYVENLSNY